jgi:hypothetical protein
MSREYISIQSQSSECFPFVEMFEDYHEVPERLKELKEHYQYDGNIIMGKEVAFDGYYWGLFWIKGKKPNKEFIKELLAEMDFDFEIDHSEVF